MCNPIEEKLLGGERVWRRLKSNFYPIFIEIIVTNAAMPFIQTYTFTLKYCHHPLIDSTKHANRRENKKGKTIIHGLV